MNGNKPKSLNDWILPLYKIYTDEEDISLISRIIKRGTRWAIGPEIDEFENKIRDYVGCEYCATLNSGTSALHAIFLAYNFAKNDEIILPSFSFISTANSVLFVQSRPIFSDIEETNLGLDPTKLKSKINKNTKAVLPMDYGGLSCKIFDIQKICNENKITLIEDAAESLGASVSGQKVGSVADASIFSFCGNKVLTTGEGGAVVTNSKNIYEKIKLIRSHGRVDNTNYFENTSESEYVDIGYNWRMSSLTAALGISQMNKLDKIIKKRQENAAYISRHLSKFSEIQVPIVPKNYEHIYQMYSIRLPNEKIRDNLHSFLTEKKIFSKVYFHPIHLTKYYKEKFKIDQKSLEVTEKISKEILTLPLYPNMTAEDKNYLIESISEFFENN